MACQAEPTSFVGPGGRFPINGTGKSGTGGGTSGGSVVPSALVGTWKNVIVIQLVDDIQTWTTIWRFDRTGTCRFLQTSFSLLEGFPRTDDRSCTFRVFGAEIEATFNGTAGKVTMPYDFAGFSPNRLKLEGLIYERIE